jgi:methionyl-tRNA formyltransferase
MNIIFFGNTKYSLIGAKIIHEHLGLSHIITIPDRPDKRGKLMPSPLKIFGVENTIPVMEINKITDETIEQIAELQPDFFVVEDYGLILPAKLLEIPKYAALNIHHSLLPKYRGSSPAPTALLNGDEITGVSVIKMTDKLDAGEILGQKEYTITSNDTTDSLLMILNKLGGELIVTILKDYENVKPIIQNENEVVSTKMMHKEDGYIDIESPPTPEKLDRMIRAYYPWPTVWTRLTINGQEKIIKLLPNLSLREASKMSDVAIPALPAGRSSKILLQVEGKNPMSVKDFINGYPELIEIIKKLSF